MTDAEKRALWMKFKVGDLYKIKDDSHYFKKLLMIVKIDPIGIVFEDQNEPITNRTVTRLKDCFGWPAVQHYDAHKLFRKIDPDSPEAVPVLREVGEKPPRRQVNAETV